MTNDRHGRVKLSPREGQVLQLICEGLRYKQIASTLGISQHTVAAYVCDLHDGLEITSVALLTLWAWQRQGVFRGEWVSKPLRSMLEEAA